MNIGEQLFLSLRLFRVRHPTTTKAPDSVYSLLRKDLDRHQFLKLMGPATCLLPGEATPSQGTIFPLRSSLGKHGTPPESSLFPL